MKDGLVERAEVLRIIQEARESGETDLRSIRASVEYLPAATPPATPVIAARAAAEEIMAEFGATSEAGWTFEEMRPLAERVESIISKHFATTTSPSETAVGGEAKRCQKCGHKYCSLCMVSCCECDADFTAPVPDAGADEGVKRAAEEIDELLSVRLPPDVYVKYSPANQEVAAIITKYLCPIQAVNFPSGEQK